jgi:LysM domain-containing protein
MAHRGSLASIATVIVVTTMVAAGCLPNGARGSAPAASGAVGSLIATLPPAPTGPTPRPTIVAPTPTPAPTFLVHVVVAGESLGTIARAFATTARSIAFWNRTTYPSLDPESAAYRPDLLKVGWTLFLIPGVILTDDEAPPLPSDEPTGETEPSEEPPPP